MDVFIEYDQATNQIFYGIDWRPADGLEFIGRTGLTDNELKKLEADILQKGFKRIQIKTVTTNTDINIHMGLWKKTRTASDTDLIPHILDVVKQPNPPFNTSGSTPNMLSADAFQTDFNEKVRAKQRPMDAFAARDLRTNEPLFGIVWGPEDGQGFMVRHRISDEQLKLSEADALRQGYKRKQVSTVTSNGVNLHIGLWVETKSAPQQ